MPADARWISSPGLAGKFRVLVFVSAFSIITLEIILTRIFSAILWYHFVFAAVSLTIFGLALGGFTAHRWVRYRERWEHFLPAAGVGVILLTASMHWLPLASIWPLYLLFFLPPFFLIGSLQAVAFMYHPAPGKLHFMDLAGASLASLGTLLALRYLDVPQILAVLAGTLIMTGAFIKQKEWGAGIRTVWVKAGMVILFVLTFPAGLWGAEHPGQYAADKPMNNVLNNNRTARIGWSRWNGMARVDVVERDDIQKKIIYMDGGAASVMYPVGSEADRELLKDTGYFALKNGKSRHVVIVGSGGGKDVRVALLAGTEKVKAIEINPAVNEAMNRYGAFNGYLLNDPRVTPVVGDARVFLETSGERYDAIYLPLVMTQAAEGMGYGLAENYALTREAFTTYWNRLTPDGQLIVKMHDSLDMMKTLITLLQVAGDGQGEAVAAQSIYILNGENNGTHNGIMYPLIVARKKPFTADESALLQTQLAKEGKTPFFMPFVYEQNLPGLTSGEVTAEKIMRMVPVDIRPATDNRPYFYNFTRGVPARLTLILAGFFAGAAVLSAALRPAGGGKAQVPAGRAYFAGLGMAFMLVEITFIQRSTMLLYSPTISTAVVVASFLGGAAFGSLFTDRLPTQVLKRHFSYLPLLVVAAAIAYSAGFGAVSRAVINLPSGLRGISTVFFFMPLGFLMGLPFPAGLKLLKETQPDSVSFIWVINGAFSVVGSILAIVLTTTLGFANTVLIGASIYALLPLTINRMVPATAGGSLR